MSTATRGKVANRFTGSKVCPICGGADDDQRGEGKRCYGFLSSDGKYARCTRGDHAGECEYDARSQAWVHRIGGKCRCGTEHAPAPPGEGKGGRKSKGTIDRTYDYHGPDDTLLFQVVRLKNPKRFLQRRPDGKGDWIWSVRGIRTVLYRLPELLAADPGETVWIVEGEKDADRLTTFGLVATTNAMGAGKWQNHYAESLHDRRVVILPDNDQAGRDHAQRIARSLAGVAAEVKVIELPDLAKKGDVSDWLNHGRTIADLRRLADEAQPYQAPAPDPSANGHAGGGGNGCLVDEADRPPPIRVFSNYGWAEKEGPDGKGSRSRSPCSCPTWTNRCGPSPASGPSGSAARGRCSSRGIGTGPTTSRPPPGCSRGSTSDRRSIGPGATSSSPRSDSMSIAA